MVAGAHEDGREQRSARSGEIERRRTSLEAIDRRCRGLGSAGMQAPRLRRCEAQGPIDQASSEALLGRKTRLRG